MKIRSEGGVAGHARYNVELPPHFVDREFRCRIGVRFRWSATDTM
jgi:hypothetical protein